ncbi:hypothetical protein FrEUN1fDRAFT_2222 [Parafrankia sp. EUN1f]|nr:hypothetical protein FrEUN1fDRAFT_2222 [Parafrankia sp. EUN1f]
MSDSLSDGLSVGVEPAVEATVNGVKPSAATRVRDDPTIPATTTSRTTSGTSPARNIVRTGSDRMSHQCLAASRPVVVQVPMRPFQACVDCLCHVIPRVRP